MALTGSAFGEIQVKDVDLRGVTKEGPVGRVAFRVFSLADLQLRGMVYKTPEIYLSMNVSDTEDEFTYTNRKFLAFARKPGMVVKYDLDGEWTKDISVDEGEFLFAFFVPISGSLLQEKYTDPNNDKQFSTVEDYLRGTENADHAEWDDITINGGPETIVRRIKNRIVKHINEVLREDEGEQASATSKLGRKYGSLLLPGRSSGNAPRPKTTSPKTPTGTKNRSATLNVLSTTPSTQTEAFTVYQMDTEVYLAANTVASMQVFVRAGSKKFTASDWEEETDLIPPFDFGNPQTEAKVADKVEIDTLAENLDQGQFFVKNGSDENLTFRLKFELIVERGQHLAPIVELSTTKDKGGE